MARCNPNKYRAFSTAFDACMEKMQAAGPPQRKLMQEAWENIDKGWEALEQPSIDVGIIKSSGEGTIELNVGGLHVSVSQSVLSDKEVPELHSLAGLFEKVWDTRLPRDGDGFIFLDQSPTCVQYIFIRLALGTASRESEAALLLGDDLPLDEKDHLPYVFHALGASELRSTVLELHHFSAMSATVLDWCPGTSSELKLVYRASRDGWTAEAVAGRCPEVKSVVMLYRVSNTGPRTGDSVVGGFHYYSSGTYVSKDDFVFMLKDGTWTGSTSFQPVKWGISNGNYSGNTQRSVDRHFGATLRVKPNGSFPGTLQTSPGGRYNVPAEAPLLALDGHDMIEMEIFKVCSATTKPSTPPPKPGLVDIPAFDACTMSAEHGREENIRTFGVSIAHLLMEERIALRHAYDELSAANTKAAASVEALAAIYGPHLAAGKEDAVIELSVRGTRMTTLRSTLQACPDSALATQFDEDKWPATEKDVDEHGRRLVDCKPSVFSKVLDVLRMRKRGSWSASGDSGASNARVMVKAADRAEFDDFVGMYFPGCESFVMDFVADTERNKSPVPNK